MKVTIGIKALNEERYIARALASAIEAIRGLEGEIILADSGSTDRTVDIARQFEQVRILRLLDPAERSCGTGAQLAFQEAQGEFFYLLDGDMVLDEGFIRAGIEFLETHPEHAAVGGKVREAQTQSIEFELRAKSDKQKGSSVAGDVDRLDCGGLYRSSAIRQLGYFADRNLHSFEEFELGARLRSRKWKLARIDAAAVEHHGHNVGGYKLMWRRLRTGYAGGPGEVIRAAIGKPHWWQVFRNFSQLRNSIAVIVWWIVLIESAISGHTLEFLGAIVAPVLFLSWRRGGLRLGLYSLFVWNMIAVGLLVGIFRNRVPPTRRIEAEYIRRANA